MKNVHLCVIVSCVLKVGVQRLRYEMFALYLHLKLGDDAEYVIKLSGKVFLSLSKPASVISKFNYFSHELLLSQVLFRYQRSNKLW
jgi:hypothetical protein